MKWIYDLKGFKKVEGERILACLATDDKSSRQLVVASVKAGKVKTRGLDLTDKVYAWCLAPEFAPYEDPTPKPVDKFVDVPLEGAKLTNAIASVKEGVEGNLTPYLDERLPSIIVPSIYVDPNDGWGKG